MFPWAGYRVWIYHVVCEEARAPGHEVATMLLDLPLEFRTGLRDVVLAFAQPWTGRGELHRIAGLQRAGLQWRPNLQ